MSDARSFVMMALALQIDNESAVRAGDLEQELHLRLAELVGNAVLDAFKAGEMTLIDVLATVNRAAAGSGLDNRLRVMGEVAIRALEIGSPKYTGRSTPPYPKWVRQLAATLVDSIRDAAPYTLGPSDSAAREYVIALMERVGLLTQPISERTLHSWCLEHRRVIGRISPRGRPRNRK